MGNVQKDGWTERMGRQAVRQIARQTDRPTDRRVDRQTETDRQHVLHTTKLSIWAATVSRCFLEMA